MMEMGRAAAGYMVMNFAVSRLRANSLHEDENFPPAPVIPCLQHRDTRPARQIISWIPLAFCAVLFNVDILGAEGMDSNARETDNAPPATALDYYFAGEYQEAADSCQSMRNRANKPSLIDARNLLLLGLCHHRLAQPAQAREAWQEVIREFRGQREAEAAALLLGAQCLLMGDYDLAQNTFETIVREYTPGESSAQAIEGLRHVDWLRELARIRRANTAQDRPALGDKASPDVKAAFTDNPTSDISEKDSAALRQQYDGFLAKARFYDEGAYAWPKPKECDPAIAVDAYMSAIRATRIKSEIADIGLRVAEINWRALPRDPAAKMQKLEDTAFALRKVIALSSPTTENGVFARRLSCACLRACDRYQELCEAEAGFIEEYLNVIDSNNLSPQEMKLVHKAYARLSCCLIEDIWINSHASFPDTHFVARQMMRKFSGRPIARDIMVALELLNRLALFGYAKDMKLDDSKITGSSYAIFETKALALYQSH